MFHGIPASGGLIEDVLGAFDGEAIGSGDDATRNGGAGGGICWRTSLKCGPHLSGDDTQASRDFVSFWLCSKQSPMKDFGGSIA